MPFQVQANTPSDFTVGKHTLVGGHLAWLKCNKRSAGLPPAQGESGPAPCQGQSAKVACSLLSATASGLQLTAAPRGVPKSLLGATCMWPPSPCLGPFSLVRARSVTFLLCQALCTAVGAASCTRSPAEGTGRASVPAYAPHTTTRRMRVLSPVCACDPSSLEPSAYTNWYETHPT